MHYFLLYFYNSVCGVLRPVVAVDCHILVTKVTSPVFSTLSVLDTEIDQDLQVLLGEKLARTRFVDVGFWFTVRQEV